MRDSIKIIGFGVLSLFVIIVLGLIILSNAGFPVIDPGITDNQLSTMNVEKYSKLPHPSLLYFNITESQIDQCLILKTTCQELIDSNKDSTKVQLNSNEFNCINSFLESLSPKGSDVSWIFYQGFFFEITFVVA